MKTITCNSLKLVTKLVMAAALLGLSLAPVQRAAAACTPTLTATFDLYAKTGSALLYGSTAVTIWGYSLTSGGAATLPGPVLEVNQGDCVQVTLHNNLSEPTALLFQGQDLIPDTAGAGAGGTQIYNFLASNPGTFLYEAGLIPGKQHQVAMGLYGALIVHPLVPFAFNLEKTLVLSEFDATLAANPIGYDMRKYAPKYFLVNGKAYPDTVNIFANAGDMVLLRYVNAGLQAHAMSTLGLSQKAIAMDGSSFAHPHTMVSETIAPGQTLDTLVTVPASAVVDTKYAVYDANLMLRNANTSDLGGMLTFLTVGDAPPPGPDITGPLLSSLTLNPSRSNGTVSVALAFTASDTTTGGNTVNAAEYWVDGGAHTPIPVGSPASVVNLNATIAAGLANGTHVVSVRAQDSLSNWSTTGTINLVVDNVGPTSSTGLSLTPNPSSGSVGVTLTFTANDAASGNSNVTAAEYWLDAGAHQAVPVASPAPVKTLNATIPAVDIAGSSHVVSVRSQDALGNWGDPATINLVVDQAGPITTNVTASPNPNNGQMPFNTSVPAVRVTANFSDTDSNIATAEGFIDTIGTTGTGFVFVATDGAFNSHAESGYGDIPLAVVNALASGDHTIYVHARDAAGNWNNSLPYASTVLVINRSLYFSTLGNTNPPGVGGTADDADIYLWNGTAFSRIIDAAGTGSLGLPNNANVDGFDRVDDTHFYLSFSADTTVPGLGTVQDEDIVFYDAGTWSVYFDGTARGLTSNNLDIDAFNIVGSTLYFSTVGNTNPPGVSGTADDADIYLWNGTVFSRVIVVTAAPYSIPSTANVDGFVRGIDDNHFYLSFVNDTILPGLGALQDEDVVYFNNGTWQVFVDGTARGLANNNQDIDAFDIP